MGVHRDKSLPGWKFHSSLCSSRMQNQWRGVSLFNVIIPNILCPPFPPQNLGVDRHFVKKKKKASHFCALIESLSKAARRGFPRGWGMPGELSWSSCSWTDCSLFAPRQRQVQIDSLNPRGGWQVTEIKATRSDGADRSPVPCFIYPFSCGFLSRPSWQSLCRGSGRWDTHLPQRTQPLRSVSGIFRFPLLRISPWRWVEETELVFVSPRALFHRGLSSWCQGLQPSVRGTSLPWGPGRPRVPRPRSWLPGYCLLQRCWLRSPSYKGR